MWSFDVRIDIRKRYRPEIPRHISEIEFTSRRQVHTSQFALRDVVLVHVRPCSGSLDELHICGIVKRGDSCSRSRLEPVKAEANRGFSLTERVINNGHPR